MTKQTLTRDGDRWVCPCGAAVTFSDRLQSRALCLCGRRWTWHNGWIATGKADEPRLTVVLLSGGLDSTVALHWAIRAYDGFGPVVALSVDYGQRHRVELARAVAIAELAGVRHRVLSVTMPWANSSLVGEEPFNPANVVVPGRNLILLTLAAAYHAPQRPGDPPGFLQGARRVVIGCSGADAERFPDCRGSFLEAASTALSLGFGGQRSVHVVAPLLRCSKADTVRMMRELGVPCERAVESSWSCYDPQSDEKGQVPCGVCLACTQRRAGFVEAGIPDRAR